MELEASGGSEKNSGSASKGGQPKKSPKRSLFGIFCDKILLTSWIFSYALILRVFRVLKSLEIRITLSKQRKGLSSSKERS
jgi:hypothetical protein